MDELELKRQAQELGFEVLTPEATADLFGKSVPTVRGAARERRIETTFTATFSEKAVRLYKLESCIKCWGPPPADKLEAMRANGLTLFVGNADGEGGITYNVLHPRPLLTLGMASAE